MVSISLADDVDRGVGLGSIRFVEDQTSINMGRGFFSGGPNANIELIKELSVLGIENAIWDDGEWISWDEINEKIQYEEWRAIYPSADLSIVPFFQDLLELAESYHNHTGRHLQVYGDIGELFGAIMYGIKLHRNYAEGSDGKLDNHFVEIKTITPFSGSDQISVKLSGHFSKLLVVKINADFEISSRMIDRERLPKHNGKVLRLRWVDLPHD